MKIALITGALVAVSYVCLFVLLLTVLHGQGRSIEDFAVGPSGDAWEYATLAQSLWSGHGFALPDARGTMQPEFFRTPGYPLVASLPLGLFHSTAAAVVLQILTVGVTVFLIICTGERLFSMRVGLAAGIIYALDPTTVLNSLTTLSDPTFVCMLMLATYVASAYISRSAGAALVGILVGYATLVRPLGLYLIPLFVLWAVWEAWQQGAGMRVIVMRGVYVCAGALLVLSPWLLRNELVAGHVALSTAGPYNALFYNIVEFESSSSGLSKETIEAQLYAQVGTTDRSALRTFAYADRVSEVLRQKFFEAPVSYMTFHIVKTVPYFISSSIEQGLRTLHQEGVIAGVTVPDSNISNMVLEHNWGGALFALLQNPFGLLERMGWVVLCCLACAGVYLCRGRARAICVLFVLIVAVLAILTGPVSFPRYRLPAEPFLLLVACASVAALYGKVMRVRTTI